MRDALVVSRRDYAKMGFYKSATKALTLRRMARKTRYFTGVELPCKWIELWNEVLDSRPILFCGTGKDINMTVKCQDHVTRKNGLDRR